MEIAARGLGIDPAELRRRNFIPPHAFPYHAPAGAVLDAGDYEAALAELLRLADYEGLQRRREEARRAGRLFGIGFAAGVEPSGSNMAYVSLAQTAQERSRTDRKSGANASAVISVDPSGQVTLRLCSTPNGQGHATVAAQIVADALGLASRRHRRRHRDRHARPAPGRSRRATIRTALPRSSSTPSRKSARQVAHKIKLLAAEALDEPPEDIELRDGYARVRGQSNKGLPFRKAAARAHWDPAGLPPGVAPGIHRDRDRVAAGARLAR